MPTVKTVIFLMLGAERLGVAGLPPQAQVNILFSAKRSLCGSNGYAASSGGYIVQVRG